MYKIFYFLGMICSNIYTNILIIINPEKAQKIIMYEMEKTNSFSH